MINLDRFQPPERGPVPVEVDWGRTYLDGKRTFRMTKLFGAKARAESLVDDPPDSVVDGLLRDLNLEAF